MWLFLKGFEKWFYLLVLVWDIIVLFNGKDLVLLLIVLFIRDIFILFCFSVRSLEIGVF